MPDGHDPGTELVRVMVHQCLHPQDKSHDCHCGYDRDHNYLVGPIAKTFWGD